MSFLTNTINIRRAVDVALRCPATNLLLEQQLDRRGGDASLELVLQRSVAFDDAMRTLNAPATRRYVARSVPAADIDDVIADAGLRLWSALSRLVPENGSAFATALVKTAIAQHHRAAGRRVATISMTAEDGSVAELVDLAGERSTDRLIEVEAVHELLTDLRRRGATPRELQRLVAFALADGDAREAVNTYLPTPCRPATLNQSVTSLRKRAGSLRD